jgi:hypothetical protein
MQGRRPVSSVLAWVQCRGRLATAGVTGDASALEKLLPPGTCRSSTPPPRRPCHSEHARRPTATHSTRCPAATPTHEIARAGAASLPRPVLSTPPPPQQSGRQTGGVHAQTTGGKGGGGGGCSHQRQPKLCEREVAHSARRMAASTTASRPMTTRRWTPKPAAPDIPAACAASGPGSSVLAWV